MSFKDIELTEEGRKLVKIAGWGNIVIGSCALTETDNSSISDYATLKATLDGATPLKVVAYGFRPYYHTEQLQMRIQMLSSGLGGTAIENKKLYLAVVSPMKIMTVTIHEGCTCGVSSTCSHHTSTSYEEAVVTDGTEGTILGFCETEDVVNLPVTSAGYSFDASINVKLRYDDSDGNLIEFMTPEHSITAEMYEMLPRDETVTNLSSILETTNVTMHKV